MEEIPREPLPEKPENWNTTLNPRDGLLAEHTYNYFNYDEVSSALQKSVRRCLWPEASQWFFEAFRTGQKCQTNVLRRFYIYASEDIGPANPSLILLLDDILDVDNPDKPYHQEMVALLALQMLVLSPKSRIFDWVSGAVISETFQFDPNMPMDSILSSIKYMLFQLEDALIEKDFIRASEWLGKYYLVFMENTGSQVNFGHEKISKQDFDNLKNVFKAPIVAKHFVKPSELFWLPVLGVATREGTETEVAILICRLCHIASKRSGTFSFRYKHEVKLFWIHAVWVLCNQDQIKETWYGDQNHRQIGTLSSYDEMVKLGTIHAKRENLLGVPDYAIDKHTAKGRKLGRGVAHFIEVGSKINNVVPSLMKEETFWLQRAIESKKKCGKLEKDYSLK